MSRNRNQHRREESTHDAEPEAAGAETSERQPVEQTDKPKRTRSVKPKPPAVLAAYAFEQINKLSESERVAEAALAEIRRENFARRQSIIDGLSAEAREHFDRLAGAGNG